MLSRQLSAARYQTVVISPRSYFVFTPLLNSTAVGTLEFRTALEPVRSRRKPNVEFIQGRAEDIDFGQKTVTVKESVIDRRQASAAVSDSPDENIVGAESGEKNDTKGGKTCEVSYDKLVISVGCYSQAFGVKGVKENAFFMKDIGDARKVRKRILECFEIASLPTTDESIRQQLMRFAVVGGGPTGMEFAAELCDLISENMVKLYPTLVPKVEITVYDVANKVLSMFDQSLGQYAMEVFRREGIKIKTSYHVHELRRGLPHGRGEQPDGVSDSHGCFTLTTEEEGEVGLGLCVWSTGNMMNPFIQKALRKQFPFPSASADVVTGKMPDETDSHTEWMIQKHAKTSAIVVDEHLRVQLHPSQSENSPDSSAISARASLTDVFALGDNATIRDAALPATAQTANQQALWLSKHLNQGNAATEAFTFKSLGIMTYLPGSKGLLQTGTSGRITGRTAWFLWRGAYLTKSVSWRNKILIPTYW